MGYYTVIPKMKMAKRAVNSMACMMLNKMVMMRRRLQRLDPDQGQRHQAHEQPSAGTVDEIERHTCCFYKRVGSKLTAKFIFVKSCSVIARLCV